VTIFDSLSPAERAKQLSNPEGDAGLAVAEWLNERNRQGNAQAIALLGITAGSHVLEIGFGNGRTVPDVIAQAADVHYTGLDISPTMVEEALRFNAELVAAGRVSLHLGSAERMPFTEASFDHVFSIGVIHFWSDAAGPLAEIRRVLRSGGVSQMGCIHPKTAPDFARREYGFYLRDETAWNALYRAAGFSEVNVQTVEIDNPPPKRYVFQITARA
jgi:ubiquinone/menaquinone biosynthesis C-methylase UbiE